MPQLQTMAQLALSLTSALKRKRSLTLSGCTASLFSAIRKCTSNSWIGNSRCFRDWSTYQSRKRKRLEAGAGLPYARSRQALHLTAVVSTIPFIVTTIHYCLAHADGPVLLTTLIAVLPRQVSILQNINVIVVYAIQLSERTTRTALVRDNLIPTNEEKRQHGLIE